MRHGRRSLFHRHGSVRGNAEWKRQRVEQRKREGIQKCKPERGNCRRLRNLLARKRMVDSHCRKRSSRVVNSSGGAWTLSAVGADGLTPRNDSRVLLKDWKCEWQRYFGRVAERVEQWIERERTSAGEAAPTQPGDVQHHEPHQAGLHWPLRLHLLHGCSSTTIPRTTTGTDGTPASLS